MQPFLTKTLLSMLEGSFHHLRWSPSLPEGGHITIAFVYFAKYNSKILLCHHPVVFFGNLYPIKLYTQKTKGMVATESRWEINAMPAAAEVSCP